MTLEISIVLNYFLLSLNFRDIFLILRIISTFV